MASALFSTSSRWMGGLILGSAGLLLFMSGCRGREETRTPEVAPTRPGAPVVTERRPVEEIGPEFGATVQDVAKVPAKFMGKTVALTGEVGQIVGPRSFTIGGEQWGGEVLVVSEQALPTTMGRTAEYPLTRGDNILVIGEVAKFVKVEVEKFGGPMEGAIVAAWDGQSYVKATKVVVTPRAWTYIPLPLSTILDEADQYHGKPITVTGYVSKNVGVNGFTIASGAADQTGLLIVGTKNNLGGQPKLGSYVSVSGRLRSMDLAAVERDLGMDLEDDLYTVYANKPVMIGTSLNVEKK